jgi:putative sterol carrier protein
MATASEKMNEILARFRRTGIGAGVSAVYKVRAQRDGGGTWIVNMKDAPGVAEGEGDAQCTIKMDAKDFVDMFEGRANGQQLFFAGKLKIEGDMGLAMKLQKLTDVMKS